MKPDTTHASRYETPQELLLAWKGCLVELHLHLDGSLSPESAHELALLGNHPHQELSSKELQKLLSVHEGCSDLNEYLERFDLPAELLLTHEQLSFCTYQLLKELKAQGLAYVELRFAPQRHLEAGLTQQEATEAVLEGRQRFNQEQKVDDAYLYSGIILCCMRGTDTAAYNKETIACAEHYQNQGVVGLDLAGAEALFPTRDYIELLGKAKNVGLNLTVHAGEAAGPESVWDALRLGASRIGHGVRSAEDAQLLSKLKEQATTLELCPTSNLHTALFTDYSEIPVRSLLEAGVRVCINSDNMAVSCTSLAQELFHLVQSQLIDDEEIEQLLLNGVDAAFCSSEIKDELRTRIITRAQALRQA